MKDAGFSRVELLRLVENAPDYPAVLWPVPEGGFEVIFPNWPGVKSYGVVRDTAMKAGIEILTAVIFENLRQGQTIPRASDPQRLIPDQDEPPGTELVMLTPDRAILRRRLGLTSAKERPGSVLKRLSA